LTENVAAGDMALKRGGRLWAVARNLLCQRFENDESVWNVIRKPQISKLADEIAPGVYFYTTDMADNIMVMLGKRYLSGPDRETSESLKLPKLRREHLISRIALKDAVRMFIREGDGSLIFPIEFYCGHDESGMPVVHGYGHAAEKIDHLYVSLAHKGKAAVAMASEKPVGVDIENIEEKSEDFLRTAFTGREIEWIHKMGDPETAIRIWVAKEAYAKMLGVGLRGDPQRYEVTGADNGMLTIQNCRIQTMKFRENYIVGWTL